MEALVPDLVTRVPQRKSLVRVLRILKDWEILSAQFALEIPLPQTELRFVVPLPASLAANRHLNLLLNPRRPLVNQPASQPWSPLHSLLDGLPASPLDNPPASRRHLQPLLGQVVSPHPCRRDSRHPLRLCRQVGLAVSPRGNRQHSPHRNHLRFQVPNLLLGLPVSQH